MGKKEQPFVPQLMIACTRDALDEQTLGVIEQQRGVTFYPRDYARPTTVLVVSVILSAILLGFAGVIVWALFGQKNDVGSMVFYVILILACLAGCAACVRWYLRSKARAGKKAAGDLLDGVYVGKDFFIFYNSDAQVHVVPKEAFAKTSTARVISTTGNRPHQYYPMFAVKDESGELHWYVYMSYPPPQAEVRAMLEDWGVADDGEEVVLHDTPEGYYCV